MAYSETRIVRGGLAHVPVLILVTNFIQGKLVIESDETKAVIKEEPVKIIQVEDTLFKEGKLDAIKEISSKLDFLEKRTDEVYKKLKKKKKDKKKKKYNN